LLHDAFFERFDRAAEIEVFDFSAPRAHEIVVVMARYHEQEMSRALVQAEPAHKPGDFELHHEPVNGRLIEAVKPGGLGEFGQRGGLVAGRHVPQQAIETLRPPKSAPPQLRDAGFDKSLDFAGLRAQMTGCFTHS
jgi:hypothetical protein